MQSLEAQVLIRWGTGKGIQSSGDSRGRSLKIWKNTASVWALGGPVWLEQGWRLETSLEGEWEPSHLLLAFSSPHPEWIAPSHALGLS